jgi:hypothetical protein
MARVKNIFDGWETGWEGSGRPRWIELRREIEGVQQEATRRLNPDTGLIEWYVIAWRGTRRDRPLVDEFVGQSWHNALAVLSEAV